MIIKFNKKNFDFFKIFRCKTALNKYKAMNFKSFHLVVEK